MLFRLRAAALVVVAISMVIMLSFHFSLPRRRLIRLSNDGVINRPLVVVSNVSTRDVNGGDKAGVANAGMSATSASGDGDARDEHDITDGVQRLNVTSRRDVDGGDDTGVANTGMSATSASGGGDARDKPDVADFVQESNVTSTGYVDRGDDIGAGVSAVPLLGDREARDEPDVTDDVQGSNATLSANLLRNRCSTSWDDLDLSQHNATSTNSRKTFTCGWAEGNFLARDVFPEFEGPYPWDLAAPPPLGHDVLIYGAHGPCPLQAHTFPGKILYHNGESFPVSRTELPCKDFVLGPRLDDKDGTVAGKIYVPYVSIVMGGPHRANQPAIFNASRRRRNSGEFFMIFAASHCMRSRDTAALSFAGVGGLHLGGRCLQKYTGQNGIEQAPDSKKYGRKKWRDNADFFHRYRFSLVLENANAYGYITEKIVNAFLAGSIPIWYGTRDVFDIFNEKAFVYYDVNNPTVALDVVKTLEENGTKYDEMLAQPILADGIRTIEKYFSFSNDVGNGKLKKLIRQMMGLL